MHLEIARVALLPQEVTAHAEVTASSLVHLIKRLFYRGLVITHQRHCARSIDAKLIK